MRRRDFIKVITGSAMAWPLAAHAQQGERIRRVGMLLPYSEGDAEGQAFVAAFQQRLQDSGWTEGRNIRFDLRWAGDDPDKARAFAKELISMTPDVIVPSSNLVTTIVQQETRTNTDRLCARRRSRRQWLCC
jgi:putative ABC transport system substrate-binding protein